MKRLALGLAFLLATGCVASCEDFLRGVDEGWNREQAEGHLRPVRDEGVSDEGMERRLAGAVEGAAVDVPELPALVRAGRREGGRLDRPCG